MATLKGSDAEVLGSNNTGGAVLGAAATNKIGFYGKTPITQPTAAGQAAAGTTASTTTSPAGCATTTQMTALINLVNAMRNALVDTGIMKGS
jgi:hypothetical protein